MKTFRIGGDGQREGVSLPASLGTHPYLLPGFGKPQGFEFPAQLPKGRAPPLPPLQTPQAGHGQSHSFIFPLLQGRGTGGIGGGN